MARKTFLSELSDQIESLLHKRAGHESAIGLIDATLTKIKSALGVGGSTGAKRGRPPGKKSGGKRRRRSFPMSGDESIMAFIKSAGNPTTKDVNKHWKAEGRGGTADNALTKLVKLKKIKRMSLKGERGSKYSV